jgi:cytochrome c-type biogenesis protein CcmE
MRGKARYVIAAVLCAGVVVFMLTVLQKNVVYLKPVSEAVADREQQGARGFRMGGTVVAGSIEARAGGGADFELTEGGKTARVQFTGSPPDLFKDCAPVVVDGHWQDTLFVTDRLLIRHGNEYKPPSDDKSASTYGDCAELASK